MYAGCYEAEHEEKALTRPLHQHVFECNTWVWLTRLSRQQSRNVTLGDIDDAEWDRLASLGMDAIWLMGVWQRSPAARAEALLPEHHESYDQALPGWTPDDVSGSPYAVYRYTVDDRFGGREGLAIARRALADRGIKLFLDFVPNHVAPDHPLLEKYPALFLRDRDKFLAGRDPFSAPWQDTVQVNAFSPSLRSLAANTLLEIASKCDGIRCDMAMLLLNEIFSRTWGDRAGIPPATEYWTDVLKPLRGQFPDCFVFAEAYWDKEWDLLQLGFDVCYDKRLYDRLVSADVAAIRAHLAAPLDYQDRLGRFLENHDEPRAASIFSPEREKAAAVILFTIPGHRIVFDGQREGARIHLPVRLGRAPEEQVDDQLSEFYAKLIPLAFREGIWMIGGASGWPDNSTCDRILTWTWQHGTNLFWVIVNYSGTASQARVRPPQLLPDGQLRLYDQLADTEYIRDGADIADQGLFVSLPPWGYHYFRVE